MTRIAFKRWHTVMQDLLEKHLDEDISRALKFETVITSAQKAAAWERLQARVQEQCQLPPLEAAPEPSRERWLGIFTAARRRSTQLWNTLVLDTAALERASAPKYYYPYPFYHTQARWMQPVIQAMSA
jgi:hypothetical protein